MAAENKFLVHLNLNGNEIRNVVLQNLSSEPEIETGTNIGRLYYDTTEKTPKIFNGTEWVPFGGSGKAMNYKGTITLSSGLPTQNVKIGDTYKVAEAGTYAGQAAKVGDIFIASSITPTWDYIPSGDETEVIVYTATNPILTATSGGICEWSITTTAASKNSIQSVAVYENSTNEQVYPNITISGDSNPTIKIIIGAASGTTITENTYTARYIY